MSMIIVKCPFCGTEYEEAPDMIGLQVRCLECERYFVLEKTQVLAKDNNGPGNQAEKIRNET